MSFYGYDPGDRNNWYQSPHLGLFPVSPAVYGGGCYDTHSYHPHGSPSYPPPPSQFPSQPSYPPPPPSQTIINGYVFPHQFPHLSANHAQLSTAAPSPHYYPCSQNQCYTSTGLFNTTHQSPLIPIHPHPSEIYHHYPPTQPHFIPTKQSIPPPLLVPTAEHLEHPQFSIPAVTNEDLSSISLELEMGHRVETNISTKLVGLGGEEEVNSQIHGVNPEPVAQPSWLLKQTGQQKFTLHDGDGNAGICYSSSLGSQENATDVSPVPPIVSEALKGQETLDSIHSLCLKTQRKKLICENATEDFVNLAVNVNVDVNHNSVREGPELVTANLKQELGLVPTQGTSIHQAKPWSARDVEMNDERLEDHALHLFDRMPRPDVDLSNAKLGRYCKAGRSGDVEDPFQITKTYMVGFPEGHESYGKSNESLQVNFDASDAGIDQATHSIGPDNKEKDGNCDGSGESGNHSRKGPIEENLVANPIATIQSAVHYENQIYPAANLYKDVDASDFEKIFASIPEVSVFYWNVNLIAACVQFGDKKSGCQMVDNILCANVISWDAILSGYFQNEDHMEVKHIFHNMQGLDVYWNAMIAGLSVNSQDNEAFTYSKKMRQHEMLPTQFSYAPILSCCAKLASSFQVRLIATSLTLMKILLAKVFEMETDDGFANNLEKMCLFIARRFEIMKGNARMMFDGIWEIWKSLVIAANKNGTEDLHANFLENHMELFAKCLEYVMSTLDALYTMQKLGFKFDYQNLYQHLSSLSKLEGDLEDLDRVRNINWEENAKTLNCVLREGLKLDNKMAVCFTDSQSRLHLLRWFVLCLQLCHCGIKEAKLFCKEAFNGIGELTQALVSQVFTTIISSPQYFRAAFDGVLCDLYKLYVVIYNAFNDNAVNLLPDDTFGIMVRNATLLYEYMNVAAKMLLRRVSREWVSSNVSIMDTIVAALCGKSIDSMELHVKMDGVGISFLIWLLAFPNAKCKKEAASIIPSLAYHIDHLMVGWNVIHALMYEEGFIIEFFERPKDRKLEALVDATTNLRIDDLNTQETPYLATMDIYILYRKVMFHMLQVKFSKAHDFGTAVVQVAADAIVGVNYFLQAATLKQLGQEDVENGILLVFAHNIQDHEDDAVASNIIASDLISLYKLLVYIMFLSRGCLMKTLALLHGECLEMLQAAHIASFKVVKFVRSTITKVMAQLVINVMNLLFRLVQNIIAVTAYSASLPAVQTLHDNHTSMEKFWVDNAHAEVGSALYFLPLLQA